ncbi:hypothetical protein D3C84_731730 [compost metagenome]
MCCLSHLKRAGDVDELSGLEGFKLSQFLAVGFQQVSQLQQDCASMGWGGLPPGLEAFSRRLDSSIDVRLICDSDAGDNTPIRRVGHGQFGSIRYRCRLSINE